MFAFHQFGFHMKTYHKIYAVELIVVKHFIIFNLMRLSSIFYFSEREVKFSSIKKIKKEQKNQKTQKNIHTTVFILETSSSVTYWRWWFKLQKRQRQLKWYFHYRRWYMITHLIKWLHLWYTSVTCKLRFSVDDIFCAVYLSL